MTAVDVPWHMHMTTRMLGYCLVIMWTKASTPTSPGFFLHSVYNIVGWVQNAVLIWRLKFITTYKKNISIVTSMHSTFIKSVPGRIWWRSWNCKGENEYQPINSASII